MLTYKKLTCYLFPKNYIDLHNINLASYNYNEIRKIIKNIERLPSTSKLLQSIFIYFLTQIATVMDS